MPASAACQIATPTSLKHALPLCSAPQPIELPLDEASVWIRTDGVVILACSTFEDWFGFGSKEVQGQSLLNFVADGATNLEQ